MIYPLINLFNETELNDGSELYGGSDIPVDNDLPYMNSTNENNKIGDSEIVLYGMASILIIYSCLGTICNAIKKCKGEIVDYRRQSILSEYLLSHEEVIPEELEESEQLTNECTICLEEFSPRQICITLPCDHKFHSHCITEWLHKDLTCPNCRVELEL